jgi:hypothetical protein
LFFKRGTLKPAELEPLKLVKDGESRRSWISLINAYIALMGIALGGDGLLGG